MHRDLGTIDGPLVLFGGPYSNLQSVEALVEEAARRGVTGSHLICTGDVVAYCGDAEATVAAVRQSGAVVVAGNCEKQLAAGALECGCGFDEGSTCDLLSAGWYAHAAAQISQTTRRWMADLPDIASFCHQGARYAVLHGGMTDIARFIWPNSPDDTFVAEWDAVEQTIGRVDHIIAGHSGIPFDRITSKGRWINAGVIGMPPHDGGQQTRYAVLDGGTVTFHRLSYDVSGAYRAMITAGLQQGYHEALLSGFWPSEDVLPSELRAPSLAKG